MIIKNRFTLVLLFLALLVLVLVFLPVLFGRESERQPDVSIPSPTLIPVSTTPTPTSTLPPTQTIDDINKQRLIAQLPYIGDGFTVEYFPNTDTFNVRITKTPYLTYRGAAERWFVNNGVNPNTLNINWSSVRAP